MEVYTGMPSLTSFAIEHMYNAYDPPVHCWTVPFWGHQGGDLRVEDDIIWENKTGWTMHGSNQNDCFNVHVRGGCYKINAEINQYYDSPDLPVYNFTDGHTTIPGNYMFPMKTCCEIVKTFPVNNHPNVVSQDVCAFNVWDKVDDNIYLFSSYFIERHTFKDGHSVWATASKIYRSTFTGYYRYYDGSKVSSNFMGRGYGYLTANADTLELTFERWQGSYDSPKLRSIGTIDVEVDRASYYPAIELIRNNYFRIDYDWDQALSLCLNQVNFFDSNGIAFAKDVGSLPATILSDLDNLKSISKVTGSGKLKVAASAFLSVHYGYKLLAADGIELVEELMRYTTKYTKHLAQSITGIAKLTGDGKLRLLSAKGHLNVYYDPYAQISSDILQFAEAVDLVPDFSNVWDMIPFSFVVDWFTNIGDLAQGIDDYFTLTQQSKVLGSIISKSETYTYQLPGYEGSYSISAYSRTCREGWYPIPRFSFQLKNPVTNLYHWLEGSALVVSNVM